MVDRGATIAVAGARQSLGARLDARKGIGPGFDHMRVGLSLAILFWHSFGISYGVAWTRSSLIVEPLRPLLATMLPMFFALSGFLVMGSALRINDLRTFITFRVLRILPALAVEISLSALILGPALTSLPLARYFGDPRFSEYFGSLLGRVRYILPGLFMDSPTPEVVNGALWTVGPEIFCYILMSAMLLTTIYRNGRGLVMLTAGYVIACVISDIAMPPRIFEVLPTKALVLAFLAGNILYRFRYYVPFSRLLALAAAAVSLVMVAIASQGGAMLALMYPPMLLLAYVVAIIGLSDLPPLPFFHRGDYSYGIYIFGFPIQQSVAHFLPDHRIWWVNFAVALPITLLFAVCSWHLIEKPALGLRKRFLAGRAPQMPQPPAAWRTRDYKIAVALLLYGAFVTYFADVFPVRQVTEHLLHGGAASVNQPVGI